MSQFPLIHPVLLCGGSGTRLWPLSRQNYPKQFSRLIGEESLFQASARRITGADFAPPLVVTGDAFRFIVTEQLAAIEASASAILIEPEGRNTAPAILAAALSLAQQDPQALMLVCPSDHIIPDPKAFRAAVLAAVPAARDGKLVTFGITPTHPETGYGYLQLGPDADPIAQTPQSLAGFVEKPAATAAAEMLMAGTYLWNAGIFLFSVEALLEVFHVHQAALLKNVAKAVSDAKPDLGFTRLDPYSWTSVQDISIDYAIMEKAETLVVMPFSAGWSDLGSWEALWQESGPDSAGNVCSDQTTAIDCTGSLLRSEADGLELVGIGLENIIVIAMPDAVLVTNRSDSQRVKEAVIALKAKRAKQATASTRDHRPWGWFESLVTDNRFQVKRIVVHPGASLSLQSHMHRSEHWIVVAGTARVTVDQKISLVTENQSVYIPLGAVHRMENPGKVPMVLIEVQTGIYLGEDDIVRYEDIYARR
jgi:mannose-1-phosphate guanylyltransferase/mannose-6-phosphate isomerase